MHPLTGADLGTLAAVFSRSGGISGKKWGETAMIFGAALGRQPFSLIERLVLMGGLPKIEDMPPPIFIVGHWRSGTTHLYNTMAKAEFGFVPPVATGLPWDLLGLSRLTLPILYRALPKTRFIDNIPVHPDSPQEDEIAIANMTPVSYYHGIYFPQQLERYINKGVFFEDCTQAEIDEWKRMFLYFMRKLYVHQGRKQLLIKNPVYTARVGTLYDMIPNAKFVNIYRNPYEVFTSMRNFYAKLFQQYGLQKFDDVDIDGAILSTYDRMMKVLDEDVARLPEGQYVELAYEELDNEPLKAIEKIYTDLGLDGYDAAKPIFEEYLSSVRGFKKNKFSYTDEAAALVESNWGGYLERWNYHRPGTEQAEAS